MVGCCHMFNQHITIVWGVGYLNAQSVPPQPPVSYYCTNHITLFAVDGWLSLCMWKLSHRSFFIHDNSGKPSLCARVSQKLGPGLMAQYLFSMSNDFSFSGTYFNVLITKHQQTHIKVNMKSEASPSQFRGSGKTAKTATLYHTGSL